MVIGNLTAYVSSGYGSSNSLRPQANQESQRQRQPVTLDAQLDPKTPNEYSVAQSPSVIPPPERAGDSKSSDNSKSFDKRANQNTDPASRAFLAVANYQPRANSIDISV